MKNSKKHWVAIIIISVLLKSIITYTTYGGTYHKQRKEVSEIDFTGRTSTHHIINTKTKDNFIQHTFKIYHHFEVFLLVFGLVTFGFWYFGLVNFQFINKTNSNKANGINRLTNSPGFLILVLWLTIHMSLYFIAVERPLRFKKVARDLFFPFNYDSGFMDGSIFQINGVYDETELIVYTLLGLVIFLVVNRSKLQSFQNRTSSKEEETQNKNKAPFIDDPSEIFGQKNKSIKNENNGSRMTTKTNQNHESIEDEIEPSLDDAVNKRLIYKIFKFDPTSYEAKYQAEFEQWNIQFWWDILKDRISGPITNDEEKEFNIDTKEGIDLLKRWVWGHADEYGKKYLDSDDELKKTKAAIRVIVFGHIYSVYNKIKREVDLLSLSDSFKEEFEAGRFHAKASVYGAVKFALLSGCTKSNIIDWFPLFEDDEDLIQGVNGLEREILKQLNEDENDYNTYVEKLKSIFDGKKRVPIYELNESERAKAPDWFKGPCYTEGDDIFSQSKREFVKLTAMEKSIYTEIMYQSMVIERLAQIGKVTKEMFESTPYLRDIVEIVDKGTEWFKESNPTAYDDLLREGGIQSSQEQDSGASLIRETQQINEKIDDQIKPPPKDEFMFPLFGNPEMEGKLGLKVRVNSDESLNQFSSSLWISFTDSLKLNFKKDLFLNKYDLHEKDLDLEYWYNIIHQRNEAYRTMFSKFIEDGSPRLSETCNAHIEEYLSKLEDLSEVNIEDWTIIRLIVYNHIYEELKSVINKIDNFREEVEKENLKLPVVDNESLFRSQLIEVKAVIYAVCAVSLKKGSYPEEITYLFKDYKKLEDEIIESVRSEFKQLIKSFQNEDNVLDSRSDTETSGIKEDQENSGNNNQLMKDEYNIFLILYREYQLELNEEIQKIVQTENIYPSRLVYEAYFDHGMSFFGFIINYSKKCDISKGIQVESLLRFHLSLFVNELKDFEFFKKDLELSKRFTSQRLKLPVVPEFERKILEVADHLIDLFIQEFDEEKYTDPKDPFVIDLVRNSNIVDQDDDQMEDVGIITHYKGEPYTGKCISNEENGDYTIYNLVNGLKEGEHVTYDKNHNVISWMYYTKDELIFVRSYIFEKDPSSAEKIVYLQQNRCEEEVFMKTANLEKMVLRVLSIDNEIKEEMELPFNEINETFENPKLLENMLKLLAVYQQDYDSGLIYFYLKDSNQDVVYNIDVASKNDYNGWSFDIGAFGSIANLYKYERGVLHGITKHFTGDHLYAYSYHNEGEEFLLYESLYYLQNQIRWGNTPVESRGDWPFFYKKVRANKDGLQDEKTTSYDEDANNILTDNDYTENSEQSLKFVFNENQAKAMDALQKIARVKGTTDENDKYVFYFWAALWVAIADAVDDEEEDEFPQGERGISKYFMSIGISEERYLKIRERVINENSHPAIISNASSLNANDKKELIKVLIDVAFYEEEEQEVFASEAVAIGIIAGIIGLDVGNTIKKIQADYQLDENELFEEWEKMEIPFINTNLM
jgi:hypothetical protein